MKLHTECPSGVPFFPRPHDLVTAWERFPRDLREALVNAMVAIYFEVDAHGWATSDARHDLQAEKARAVAALAAHPNARAGGREGTWFLKAAITDAEGHRDRCVWCIATHPIRPEQLSLSTHYEAPKPTPVQRPTSEVLPPRAALASLRACIAGIRGVR